MKVYNLKVYDNDGDTVVSEYYSSREKAEKRVSDMEFDMARGKSRGCNWDGVTDWNPTAQQMIKGMYEDAGYKMPDVVYWNLNSRNDNFPTSTDETGTALVSGFSPSIMKSVLTCEEFTPYQMMMETIGSSRYEPITV